MSNYIFQRTFIDVPKNLLLSIQNNTYATKLLSTHEGMFSWASTISMSLAAHWGPNPFSHHLSKYQTDFDP